MKKSGRKREEMGAWRLCERTKENVIVFYERTEEKEIKKLFPKQASSLEEALIQFQNTQKSNLSYGKTIYIGSRYIGDIWCYGIHQEKEVDAMLSYCIFEKEFWNRGIATEVVSAFLEEVIRRFALESIGAFTYSFNKASIRVLEKNNFQVQEIFLEDGVESQYFIKKIK